MGFKYNAMGQVRYMDYPHEVTGDLLLVEYRYSNDAFHWLKHIPGYVDNISYDWNGRVEQIDFTNGLSENTHRDELGRPIDAEVDMDPSSTVDKFVQRYDYAWNIRGNLSTPVSISYLYDAGGDRVRKVSSVSGTTTYMFLGLNVQYEERADGTVDYYVYALGRQVARVRGNAGHHGYKYEWYYYHSDYLNSVWAVSDAGGKVVWAKRYRPFGSEAAQSGTLENEYQFTGKGYDAEAGLYYFNARWYDTDIGRFISEDPVWGNIRDPQSLNRFRYARNNPLKLTDPTGMYDDQDNDWDTERFGDSSDDSQDDGYGDGEGDGQDDVWFVGVGASVFIGPLNKVGRGIGGMTAFGIALDISTGEMTFFTTGGSAKPKNFSDQVTGINLGAGFLGGYVKGDINDFLGNSNEKTLTLLVGGFTKITTNTGNPGWSLGFGGKGFGLSYTDINTNTSSIMK